jgi:uncharacterized protein YyaL (SSP411 family)
MRSLSGIIVAAILIFSTALLSAGCSGRGSGFPPPERPLPNTPAEDADACGLAVPEVFSELSYETLEYRKGKKDDVLRSINELMGLIERRADAEWGGVFDFADATGASKRKLLIESALAARVLANASAATGSPERAAAAIAVADYVAVFLADPQGGFYSAQESGLMGPDGEMTGEDFYKLPDAARRKIGMPARDKTMRVADNAAAAAALLRASDVLSRPAVESAAHAAVERILRDAWSDEFGAARAIPPQGEKPDFSDKRLADNALLARALIETYQTTGETKFLDKAEAVAALIHKNFRRADAPVFSLYEGAVSSGGSALACSSDLFSNLAVVSVLADLHILTDNEEYKTRAEAIVSTLKAMSSTELFSAFGRETLFRMEHKPLVMVVVGSKKDPATAALRSSALRFYEPLKLVMTVDPELDSEILERLPYSARPKPTLYACVDTACSFPVDDPAQTEPKMRVFTDRHMFAQPQPAKPAF